MVQPQLATKDHVVSLSLLLSAGVRRRIGRKRQNSTVEIHNSKGREQ